MSLISPTEPARPCTIVAFGDSLTEGGSGGEKAWVKLLETESAGKLKVINEGKGGRATGDGKQDFEAMTARQPRADQIILALGTNDSRDLKPGSVEKAASNVSHMVDRARQCYGPWVKVLVVGPPNINKAALVATKPIANEREAQLKALGTAFATVAKEKQCDYLSLFGTVPEETMTKDGVHPDATGHAAIAKALQTKLETRKVNVNLLDPTTFISPPHRHPPAGGDETSEGHLDLGFCGSEFAEFAKNPKKRLANKDRSTMLTVSHPPRLCLARAIWRVFFCPEVPTKMVSTGYELPKSSPSH